MAFRALFLFLLFGHFRFAFAYPEYAVRYNMISCNACHVSPTGGGPRNINGKLFGAYGYKMNPFLIQKYVSADFRALFYYPQRPSPSRDGMGVMSGSIAGHVAVDEAERIELVFEHNLAGFSAGNYRDTYALFRFVDEGKRGWLDSILVGRFRAPFGIVTDEHRTYTRLQTGSRWFDFDTGIMASGSPSDQFHYDLALVNGEKEIGNSLNAGQADRFGGLIHLRWMPGALLFGVSGNYYDQHSPTPSPKAVSLYSIFSLGRWTDDRIPAVLHVEYTRARGWNSLLAQGFTNDSSYADSIRYSGSEGWLVLAEYYLTRHFVLIYKYDFLKPDQDFPADFYDRHGIGFRWYIGPNTSVQARTEFARATQPSESGSTAIGGQSATFGILQIEL
jgi:hypothetical protein